MGKIWTKSINKSFSGLFSQYQNKIWIPAPPFYRHHCWSSNSINPHYNLKCPTNFSNWPILFNIEWRPHFLMIISSLWTFYIFPLNWSYFLRRLYVFSRLIEHNLWYFQQKTQLRWERPLQNLFSFAHHAFSFRKYGWKISRKICWEMFWKI